MVVGQYQDVAKVAKVIPVFRLSRAPFPPSMQTPFSLFPRPVIPRAHLLSFLWMTPPPLSSVARWPRLLSASSGAPSPTFYPHIPNPPAPPITIRLLDTLSLPLARRYTPKIPPLPQLFSIYLIPPLFLFGRHIVIHDLELCMLPARRRPNSSFGPPFMLCLLSFLFLLYFVIPTIPPPFCTLLRHLARSVRVDPLDNVLFLSLSFATEDASYGRQMDPEREQELHARDSSGREGTPCQG